LRICAGMPGTGKQVIPTATADEFIGNNVKKLFFSVRVVV